MINNSNDRLEATRTAAAVLVILEGSSVPLEELLGDISAENELAHIAKSLRASTRQRRAEALATCLEHLAIQLDRWSIS